MNMNFEWHTRDEKLLVVAYWWEQQKKLCCICGEEMEPYKRQNSHNPRAATVEHLIPRRDNGPNTAGNVRLAHALCNHTLGALWEQNRYREMFGMPTISEKSALHNARNKKKVQREPLPRFKKDSWYPKESAYYASWMKWKDEQEAKALRGHAWRLTGLPRGATLTPEYQRLLGGVKTRTARKMTAAETARWLSDQGVRGA
jgi:hypothetical protein